MIGVVVKGNVIGAEGLEFDARTGQSGTAARHRCDSSVLSRTPGA